MYNNVHKLEVKWVGYIMMGHFSIILSGTLHEGYLKISF